jgi:hypothetical protein
VTWRSTCCTGWSGSVPRRSVHVPVIRKSLKEADRRRALLEAARESVLTAVARSGATRIEFTAAFPELDTFTVWLCVKTDAQRDALQPCKNPAFTRVFKCCSMPGSRRTSSSAPHGRGVTGDGRP